MQNGVKSEVCCQTGLKYGGVTNCNVKDVIMSHTQNVFEMPDPEMMIDDNDDD